MPASPRALRPLLLLLAIVLTIPATALTVAAPAYAAPDITVTGTVVDGLGDGLDGVTVTALTGAAWTEEADEVTTEAGGGYALTLPAAPGRYRVQFAEAAHQATFYGGGTPVEVVVDAEGRVLVDDVVVEDNELDEVTLSSTDLHRLTGLVRSGSTPVSGIAVDAFVAGDDESPVSSATTDGAGAYALDLPLGRYDLRYTDPTQTYTTTWYDGTETVTVTVVDDAALETVQLTEPAAGQEFPIAGRVEDANGDPVDGVQVTVTGVGGSTDSGTDLTETVGEDGGLYRVEVEPGTYQLSFARTGWVTSTYGGATTATVTVGNAGTLTVAPAEPLSGNRLGDHVLASDPYAVTAEVQTAGGAAIPGITVRAFPESSTDPTEIVDTATTGGTGSYTLNLPVGGYDLEFVDDDPAAPTYASTTLADVQVLQGGSLQVGGEPAAELATVTMSTSGGDTLHAVLGSVVDVNGADVDGLTVTAQPASGTGGDNTVTGSDGVPGAHGRYRLMLRPGDYTISVAGGADWKDATFTNGGTGTALVTVAPNGSLAVNGTGIVGRDLGDTEVLGSTEYPLSGTVTDGTTGLPGITVKAYADDDLTAPVATTTAGAGGAWTLADPNGLVVGSYVVELTGKSNGKTYDRTFVGGATATPVEMAQGGTVRVGGTLVPGNTLTPAVVMSESSATKAHPVVGQVVDANDEPIAGVEVTGVHQGSGPDGTATTGADGRYRLMLRAGTYRVTFALAGFTPATYPGTGLSEVDVVVDLDGTVRVGAGPVEELDQVSLVDATGDATISGVLAHDSDGVGGITVEVFPAGGDLTEEARAGTATTAGTGAWSVGGLRIGTYVVRFTDNVNDATTYIQTYVGGSELATATPVRVAQGDRVWLDTTPTAPNGALGTTTIAKADDTTTYDVAGVLLDEADDPISGATVTAVPQGSGTQATADTGTDGRYVLKLKPGTYRLDYAASGFAPGVSYPGAGETPVPVVVAPGGAVTPSPLDAVTLAETTGHATVSGKVTSTTGDLTGISVEVFPEGDLDPGSRVASTSTSGTGTWSISGLRIGEYTVRFTDGTGAHVQTYLGGATELAQSTPVTVRQGVKVYAGESQVAGGALGTTPMPKATQDTLYPLKGEVEDAAGDPLPGVTVKAIARSASAATADTTTDGDGAYTLQLKAGVYEVEFGRTGWTTGYYLNSLETRAQVVVSPTGVTIQGETEHPVDRTLEAFTLRSTVTHPLAGKVLGGSAPLAGLTVRAIPQDTDLPAISTTTGADGGYSLPALVGLYQVEIVGRSVGGTIWDGTFYGPADAPSVIKVATGGRLYVDGSTESVARLADVSLKAGTGQYDLRGTVSDERGEPLPGVTVRVFRAGTSSQAAWGTNNPEGRYTIRVPVGRYSLRFEKAGKVTAWLLNADSEAEYDEPAILTVAPGGAISAPGVTFEAGVIEDVQLLLPRVLVTAPRLSGKLQVGQRISTTIGRWSPNVEQYPEWRDSVNIEWFIDGRPADDDSYGSMYEKYTIPAAAGGRKLSYRITIDDPSEDGYYAPAVYTSKPVSIPKAKPTLVASYKKGKLTVVVKVAGLKKPTGSIVVLDGRKKVGKATLKARSKGKAVIKLKKLKKGTHKLTISYGGGPNVAKGKVKLKIKA
jgi:hypothetical protein